MDKTQAIKIVRNCAEKYKANLLDKNFLFVFIQNGTVKYCEISCFKRNFLHLTGLVIDKAQMSANKFFEKCINNKLSTDEFKFKENGTTELKLQVLPSLMSKNLSVTQIGDYYAGCKIELRTDKIIGNGRRGCIGLVYECNTIVPNTVINEDVRNVVKQGRRIIATFRKDLNEDVYSELVYTSKEYDFKNANFPNEIDYLKRIIINYITTKSS